MIAEQERMVEVREQLMARREQAADVRERLLTERDQAAGPGVGRPMSVTVLRTGGRSALSNWRSVLTIGNGSLTNESKPLTTAKP